MCNIINIMLVLCISISLSAQNKYYDELFLIDEEIKDLIQNRKQDILPRVELICLSEYGQEEFDRLGKEFLDKNKKNITYKFVNNVCDLSYIDAGRYVCHEYHIVNEKDWFIYKFVYDYGNIDGQF